MSVATRIRAARPTLTRAAAVAVSSLSLLLAIPWAGAGAAVIDGAITGVNLLETAADKSATMRLDVDWRVPSGTMAGDQFTLRLPPELHPVNGATLQLKDAAGSLVATATVQGGLVTFTMTAYAQSHVNVSGKAWLSVTFGSEVDYGDTIPLEFLTSGKLFTDSVTVTGGPRDYSGTATKWQKWVDPLSWKPPRPVGDRILWSIAGPRITTSWAGQTYVFTDVPGPGQAIDCDYIEMFWGSDNNGGVTYSGYIVRALYSLECTPEKLVVSLPTHFWEIGRIPYMMGMSYLTDGSLSEYVNSGSVAVAGRWSLPVRRVLTVASGGQAQGELGALTLTKYATADGPADGDFDTSPGKQVNGTAVTPLTILVSNTGTAVLRDIRVADTAQSGPPMANLTCDFSPLGGPSSGVTWAGPFPVGTSFSCAGVVPELPAAGAHADTAAVTAMAGGATLTASDPFHAWRPAAPATGSSTTTSSTTTSTSATTSSSSTTTSSASPTASGSSSSTTSSPTTTASGSPSPASPTTVPRDPATSPGRVNTGVVGDPARASGWLIASGVGLVAASGVGLVLVGRRRDESGPQA